MKKMHLHSLILLLSFCFLMPMALHADAGAGTKMKNSARDTTRNESIKAMIEGLDLMGRLSNPELAKKAQQQLLAASENLPKAAFERLVGEMKDMGTKSLSELIEESGEGVLKYGQALARGTAGGMKAAQAIVAGNGDEAGLAAVSLLKRLQSGAGEVGAREVERVAAQLGPKRSKAFLAAIAGEAEKNAGRMKLVKSLGTLVDGLFVFNDAINIYYSDDAPEEKTAAAVGKGVDYTMATVAGAKATALGAGLAPAIIIGLSAMAVGELTKEMIGLHFDSQNAALKQKWAAIRLREMAIERMLRVNQLMRAGKVDEADAMYRKLYRFVFDHTTEMYGDSLLPAMDKLEGKLEAAQDQLQANRILNRAGVPYRRAEQWYLKGVNLKNALSELADARAELADGLSSIQPYLAEAKAKVEQLEGLIQQAIENATPVEITAVDVPAVIAPDEWGQLVCHVSGGIPAYVDAADGAGVGSYSSVLVYWQAPEEPGTYTVSIRVRDNIDQTVSTEVSVVVGELVDTDTQEESQENETDEGTPYDGDGTELSGTWKVKGTCTSAYLGASLQYLSDDKKAKQEASNAMVGTTTPLPDLNLDQVKMLKRIWTVTQSGDYYTLTPRGFSDEGSLGGSQYRIRFTGPNTFEGTMESRGRFGEKMNLIHYNVSGTRMSD
ncbi:MAG: hypothetical protein JXX29_00705 [Deltaproteobacteria bacterium]|nr:hypothetical protein [Deltaproteobacteria bacterium]MBN2670157.1 hypothetical protein [Deltaproteobacteria bacterium]